MALTGSQFGGNCYADANTAFGAYLAAGGAISQTPGTTTYLNRFEFVSGVWRMRVYTVSSTGTITLRGDNVYALPGFPACDPVAPFTDGMTIGWGVAAAMVAVAAIKLMRKGVQGG